jgi:uncharacterized protein
MLRRVLPVFGAIGLWSGVAVAQEAPPDEYIPAPVAGYPEFKGGFVHDFAGVLDDTDEETIRGHLQNLETETEVDAVAVTINSVADYQPGVTIEDFATGLFNAWELGDAGINDGVLILVAVADRTARVTIGDGFSDEYLQDSDDVIDVMLPYFRNGAYGDGIIEAAALTARRFRQADNAGTPPATDGSGGAGLSGGGFAGSDDGGGIPAGWWWGGGLGATAFVGTGGALVARRIRPRKCGQCGRFRKRLKGTAAEEPHLDPGQEVEEKVNSVEYDVWHCDTCDTAELARYGRLFSGHKKCPSCAYKTMRSEKRTLTPATTTSTGTALVTRDCKHCDFHDEQQVTIPRRPKPSSGSGRSSSRSSRGSRGPSGGGRSSGRGSSDTW